jgi:integrase
VVGPHDDDLSPGDRPIAVGSKSGAAPIEHVAVHRLLRHPLEGKLGAHARLDRLRPRRNPPGLFLSRRYAQPFGIAWRLACYGLRRGEILALRWDAINFMSNTLLINEARLAIAGGSATGSPKTESSVRTLPMPNDLAVALRGVKRRQAESKLQLGSRWPDTGLVVVDALGAAPHPDTLTHAWSDALAAAKLPHVRLHDARHSCATLMHFKGVPAVVIAAWLGHTDARSTLSVYAHSTNTALADAATAFQAVEVASFECWCWSHECSRSDWSCQTGRLLRVGPLKAHQNLGPAPD